MAYGVSSYYDGSHVFAGVSDSLGISIDKVNFVISQVAAIFLASLFRTSLHQSKTSATNRHVFSLTIGVIIGYFCFGRQAIHIAALPLFGYLITTFQSTKIMPNLVLGVSLVYLSLIHIHRLIYDYGSSNLDITGPLMVVTQKVTTLAYNLHDGLTKKDEQMTNTMKEFAIRKPPTFLEYMAYCFHFPSLMAGPGLCYREYDDFIHGTDAKDIPNPRSAVVKKLLVTLFCAIIFLVGQPFFPIDKLKENDFVETTSLSQKILYIFTATAIVRFKYYFVWTLADAICNNSGLGYNGRDENGEAKWDKFTNVDIFQFEFALNLKGAIDGWNFGTNRWLRMIVYDRTKTYPMPLTYALSSVWHGFYPGYYLTFAGAGLCTAATRVIRKTVRVYFLANNETKLLYDGITFVVTRVMMTYLTFSFVLLEFWPSIRLYKHMYWFVHIVALLFIFVVPKVAPRTSSVSNKNGIAQALTITNEISRH